MIQIQRREQFTKAAERANQEHIHVRRYAPSVYEVTNTAKNHNYIVRFTRRDSHVFGQCTCEAGTPTTARNRVPMVCKHLFAAIIFHRAIFRMKLASASITAEIDDYDDPDCDERNW